MHREINTELEMVGVHYGSGNTLGGGGGAGHSTNNLRDPRPVLFGQGVNGLTIFMPPPKRASMRPLLRWAVPQKGDRDDALCRAITAIKLQLYDPPSLFNPQKNVNFCKLLNTFSTIMRLVANTRLWSALLSK